MGNDGGSIPTRRELVKEAARDPTAAQLKETQQEQQQHKWTTCSLSQEPLQEPIVSDGRGRLFNKAAVLEYLLGKTEGIQTEVEQTDDIVKGAEGITSLKDVVEVLFERQDGKFICPVTHKELVPGKSVYLVPCGHAFSDVAIREVGDEACVQCSTGYKARDVIPILPLDTEPLAQRLRKLKAEGLSHSLKRGKRKREQVTEDQSTVKSRDVKGSTSNNVKASTKVKRVKMENPNDFMTRGYTIPARR